jgi:O-antigen ligase
LKQYWGRTKILLFYFIAVTGLLTVVATDNRGTQLGLACVGIWYAMKSRLGLKALLGILIVGVALYQIAPPEMLAKFETAGEDGTSQARLVLWGYGVDVVQDHPLLGIGYENWVDYCWYFNPHRLEKGVSCLVPHNTYVSAAAETGLLGLLFYLLLIITIFRVNMRTRANARTSKNDFIYYMAHGLDAGLVGYMVSSIFVTVLFYPIFWVQLALTVALYEISRKKIQCAV